MRIGLIAPPWTPVPPPLYGGIELVVDELARGFADSGHDVTLFTTGDSTSPVPMRWVLPHAEGTRIGVCAPELRHVIGAYETLGDAEIIHDHTLAGPLMAAARFEGWHGRRGDRSAAPRVVTTIHGPFNEDLIPLYRAIAPTVPIVAVSEAQRRAAPEVPVARVIHHGIEAALFPFSAEAKGDDKGPYCLFLGRMNPDKGAHRAIEAARKAGLRILLAAKMREPWEINYFNELVEPLLGDDAVYLGEVPHETKLELLAGATALLFPITWNEPFGLVMLEAMACGTPVIAFPEGAAPEVVGDGVTGFLCHDVPSMAEAIGKVGGLRRSDCRAVVEGVFSTRRMVADHIELFAQLLGD